MSSNEEATETQVAVPNDKLIRVEEPSGKPHLMAAITSHAFGKRIGSIANGKDAARSAIDIYFLEALQRNDINMKVEALKVRLTEFFKKVICLDVSPETVDQIVIFITQDSRVFDLSSFLEVLQASNLLPEAAMHALSIESGMVDSYFLEIFSALLKINNVEIPHTPAYKEAHYVITIAEKQKSIDKENIEAKKIAIATKIHALLFKEFKYSVNIQLILDYIENLVTNEIENISYLHVFIYQVIDEILALIAKKTEDCSTESLLQLRKIILGLIDDFAVSDKHYKYAVSSDYAVAELSEVNLDVTWSIRKSAIYRQKEGSLPISYEELKSKEVGKDPDSISFNLNFLLQAERKTLQAHIDLANKIGRKTLRPEYLNHPIMQSSDILELKRYIMAAVRTEEAYINRQLAIARIGIIHAAVLIKTGYSEKAATEATGGIIRKINTLPHVFQFNNDCLAEEADENCHHYDCAFIPGAKLFIGEPKLEEACGLKIILKPPKASVLEVIQDGSRGTLTIPDEEWEKGEEHILALGTIAIANFIPMLGTDIVQDRTRIAVKLGSKTKKSSSGKVRSIQVTFVNKHGKISKRMNGLSQSTFELQIRRASDFKIPDTHPNYLPIKEEREEFDQNRKDQANTKFGFDTNYTDYFIGLACYATNLEMYNESLDAVVTKRSEDIAERVNNIVGEQVLIDPLANAYIILIDILNGRDSDKIIKAISELMRQDIQHSYLFETLRVIFIKMIELKQNAHTAQLHVAANKLAVAINQSRIPLES